MKFSYHWLRELVPGLELQAHDLAQQITMKTAECEAVETVGELLAQACAARIEAVEPMAGGKVKAVVETGRWGQKTVVCGAPNCRPGIVSAYVPAPPKWIAGVESDGMLASGAELGINRDHQGILELTAEPGDPILPLVPDFIIEVDNKSITHRPDLWGHVGMAREIAAITRRHLADPVRLELLPSGAPCMTVQVDEPELCPRYCALVLENVTVRPSPLWLQFRLQSIGLNPINNIVDVTNYVMAELAQPTHAFDADRLAGGLVVRRARSGERLTALNAETYELDSSHLVIADRERAIALAGVIGGADTAISPATRRIVLESATFNPTNIRRTSAALKLRTDASMRFEKSQDPVNALRGVARAIELFSLVSPGIQIVGGVADIWHKTNGVPPIELPLDWLDRKLGRAIPAEEVKDILERLEFGVQEVSPRVFSIQVPSWRATKDISIKDDLVEEVGRMVGYDSIPLCAPLAPVAVPPQNDFRLFERRIRGMASAQGFHESYNYSFVSEEAVRELGMDPAAHVRVQNPIASDQALLRRSLLPGLLKNIRDNRRFFDDFRLFEIGREIHPTPGAAPEERPWIGLVIYAKTGSGEEQLRELARVADCLAPGAEVWPMEPKPYMHPARAGKVSSRGQDLGEIFEFHPSLLEQGRAAVLYLDLQRLHACAQQKVVFRPIRRYPVSLFDVAVVAPVRTLAGVLKRELERLAAPELQRVEFVSQYIGPPLAEGTKSVSFRLVVGAPDRTLSSEEVNAIRERVIAGLRQRGYGIRE
jgi:phenylalanyl-tRNA synthetase beta chain